MIKVKEFKGTFSAPGIEEQMNDFLSQLPEETVIHDVYYSTDISTAADSKGNHITSQISSALMFYDAVKEEGETEKVAEDKAKPKRRTLAKLSNRSEQ